MHAHQHVQGTVQEVLTLLLLQSNEWIRVRIQQMEPDLMDVGATLEEAKALRREHDELLLKLNVSTFSFCFRF